MKKSHFLSVYGKNNVIISDGSFDVGDNQATVDLLYPFLEACFRLIKTNCEAEWAAGEQGILTINRGIQAVIRVIDDIVIQLLEQKKIVPKSQNIDEIVDEVEYYLEPLMSYINTIDDPARKELKGFLGGGADNKFWRR